MKKFYDYITFQTNREIYIYIQLQLRSRLFYVSNCKQRMQLSRRVIINISDDKLIRKYYILNAMEVEIFNVSERHYPNHTNAINTMNMTIN